MFPDRRCRTTLRDHLCAYCYNRSKYNINGTMTCGRCLELADFCVQEILAGLEAEGIVFLADDPDFAVFEDGNAQ